jgi:hypothetical protein
MFLISSLFFGTKGNAFSLNSGQGLCRKKNLILIAFFYSNV